MDLSNIMMMEVTLNRSVVSVMGGGWGGFNYEISHQMTEKNEILLI